MILVVDRHIDSCGNHLIYIWIPRYLTENSLDRYLDLGVTSDRYLSSLGRSDTQIYLGKLYLTPNTGYDLCDELSQYNVQGRTRRQSETHSIGSSKYKNLKLKKEEEE